MENRKEFSEGGICHIVCECALPDLPEGKAGVRMQKILSQIKESFFLSAEKALPALAEKYKADPSPQKHLRHRPLSLSFEFCAEEKRSIYHITWKIRLSRCGRTLSQKKGEVRFDKRSGYLLSGREKKRIQKTKARRAIGF